MRGGFCFLFARKSVFLGHPNVQPFLQFAVIFFGFNGNFNGKMTKINEMTKTRFSGVQNGSQSV